MHRKATGHLIALTLVALSLSACVSRYSVPASAALSEDDDSYCRSHAGQAGSPEYVACRKDRDVQRSDAITRADSKQRDLAEWMLNHP